MICTTVACLVLYEIAQLLSRAATNSLCSCQQCMLGPVAPHPCPHWLLSLLFQPLQQVSDPESEQLERLQLVIPFPSVIPARQRRRFPLRAESRTLCVFRTVEVLVCSGSIQNVTSRWLKLQEFVSQGSQSQDQGGAGLVPMRPFHACGQPPFTVSPYKVTVPLDQDPTL